MNIKQQEYNKHDCMILIYWYWNVYKLRHSVFILVVSEYGPNKAGWTLPADLSICHQIPIPLLLCWVSYFCGIRTMCEQPFLLVYLQTEWSSWPFQDLVLQLLPLRSFCSLAVQNLQLQSITEAIPTCSIKRCSLLTWEGSWLCLWTSGHQIWDFPMLSSIVFYKVA